MFSPAGKSTIGRPRVDAREKVTGAAVYVGDVDLPSLAWGKVLHGPYPHARIRSLDLTQARKLPGVLSIVTGRDFAQLDDDPPVMAIDEVVYEGQPVVAVAATDLTTAENACDLIQVDYEPQSYVTDARESVGPNLCDVWRYEQGDVVQGFERSDYILEEVYTFPSISHHPMEPVGGCVAEWKHGTLMIYAPLQRPASLRDKLARLFHLDPENVCIRVPFIGGAFGSKTRRLTLEPIAAALAAEAKRTVKMAPSMEENFKAVCRHEAVYQVKSGVMKDGTVVSREVKTLWNMGAYPSGPLIMRRGACVSAGPYQVPHLKLEALGFCTNRMPSGPMRGVGVPQVAWGCESHTDSLAYALGMDPLEFRKKNLLRPGELLAPANMTVQTDLAELLQRSAEAIHWRPTVGLTGTGKGKGLACVLKSAGGGCDTAYALLTMDTQGRVVAHVNGAELGQGSYSLISELVARGLGVSREQVHVAHPDTSIAPYYIGTSGSRATVTLGSAVQDALRNLKREVVRAATMVAGQNKWKFKKGCIQSSNRTLSLSEVVRGLGEGAFLSALGSYMSPRRKESWVGSFWEANVGAAELEVDGDTGRIDITHYVAAVDVGRAIHPGSCRAQVEGGVIQGVGHTLYEELVYHDGVLANSNDGCYRIPRFRDAPKKITCLLLESKEGPGPFGSIGMGESGILAVAPAVGNAVFQATGTRVKDLPLTPEKILRARQQLQEVEQC